jgi:hypothetical protein
MNCLNSGSVVQKDMHACIDCVVCRQFLSMSYTIVNIGGQIAQMEHQLRTAQVLGE